MGLAFAKAARYEYDPFGQTIRASGTMAMLNPVRFSSKPVDDETDLAYYGYRYLNPNTGRWLNRDPMNEKGGLNVFSLTRNAVVNSIDFLGLFLCENEPRPATFLEELAYANQDDIGAFTQFLPGYPKMGINADRNACCTGDGKVAEQHDWELPLHLSVQIKSSIVSTVGESSLSNEVQKHTEIASRPISVAIPNVRTPLPLDPLKRIVMA